jgi:VWFA-related protein
MLRALPRLQRMTFESYAPLKLSGIFLLVVGLAAGCLASRVASAEEDASASEGRLIEIVDVVLVNVEVWVSDRKGNPVEGLSGDDFEVFEDGRPMEITHVAEIRAGRQDTAESRSESSLEEEPIAAPLAEGTPAHLVFYFDQMHLGVTSVRRIARDLERFLASENVPASRVAILSQGYDLDLVADFGSTLDELLASLDEIAESNTAAGGSLDAQMAIRRLQQSWEIAKQSPSPCRQMVNQARAEIASRVAELKHHFGITLHNLHATTRFLSALPGLKMLVLVGDSLELDPGRDLLRFAQNVCPNDRGLDELALLGDGAGLRRALLDLALSANANRVTFYPMQASGLTPSSIFGAENRALDTVANRGVDSLMRRVQKDGLLSLARETGGVATVNRNDFGEPLQSIARDMGSYYSLAYAPEHAGTGENRSIEVRVDVPGANVRHRPGYRDKSAKEIRDEKLEGAIAFGLMDNPLALRLVAGDVRQGAGGRLTIPLHFVVPAENLAFLSGSRQQARVEVVVRASEAATGEVTELIEVLTADHPLAGSSLCDLALDLSLQPGIYVVGVAARDLSTNLTSIVSTTFALGSPEGAGPVS